MATTQPGQGSLGVIRGSGSPTGTAPGNAIYIDDSVAAYAAVWISVAGVWTPICSLSARLAAALPAAAAGNRGWRAIVTDANATFTAGIGAAVAGGGANVVPVFSDGAAWRIG